MDAPSIGNDYK